MRWLCLLVLVGCRTQPLELAGDGGQLPDLLSRPDLLPMSCGGFGGGGCPFGQFCEVLPGACFDGPGRCIPFPTSCDRRFDPVCGCDFVTYSNDCERQRAGMTLAFNGFCEGPDLQPPDLPPPVIDLAQPRDMANPCSLGCGSDEYCFIHCTTPAGVPGPSTCELLPQDCGGCDCFAPSSACACLEDPATGRVTYQCFISC